MIEIIYICASKEIIQTKNEMLFFFFFLKKERKHLFSNRARKSDFGRTGWPRYLKLKAANYVGYQVYINLSMKEKTVAFSCGPCFPEVTLYLQTPTWQVPSIK